MPPFCIPAVTTSQPPNAAYITSNALSTFSQSACLIADCKHMQRRAEHMEI
uniref:Uncharacterized protein n=1 Tax=Anguilla anguilla TaxID=7936 RepID=A0A0E9T9E4_ANGAN